MKSKKFTNDYAKKATIYSMHSKETGTLSIAYKELGLIFDKHVIPGKISALDYGMGTGRSLRYLEDIGFDVDGVDIDENMLNEAARLEPSNASRYMLIQNGKIPQRKSKYDLIFSSLVVLEISSMEGLYDYFSEAERVLKFNGVMIVLTVSDNFYKHQWVSVDTDYPGNTNARRGDKVRVRIKEINLELDDFYWEKNDYKDAFEKAGFSLIDVIEPKGSLEDQVSWISEVNYSPYTIMVLKKRKCLESIDSLKKHHGLDVEVKGKGIFSETFRDPEVVVKKISGSFVGYRNKSSTIKLLMQAGDYWPFHKLESSETFRFLEGNDLIIHSISPEGEYKKIYLGDGDDFAVRKYTVPSGYWYAEEVDEKCGYSLIEATTVPAFDQNDFVEASQADLLNLVDEPSESLRRLIGRLSK